MAAALALEAHGRALRLAAEVGGVHHQGLAALAGHLRRRGCSDRRLLRRLSALHAAVGIIRHITVVSVQELEKDLHAELVKMEAKVEALEVVFAEEEPQGVQTERAAEVVQWGAQPVAVHTHEVEPQMAQQAVSVDREQQLAALAKWQKRMGEREAQMARQPAAHLPQDLPATAQHHGRGGARP